MSLRLYMSMLQAELYSRIAWYRRNRSLLVAELLWPYATIMVLLGLGLGFGDIERYQETMGIANVILYLLAASATITVSLGVLDNAASIGLWHRWLGTLPYIMLSPASLVAYSTLAGIAAALTTTATQILSISPVVVALGGLQSLGVLLVLASVLLIGMLPLTMLGTFTAMTALVAKQEGNLLSFIVPLIIMVSGVFYPVEILPRSLEVLSRVVPLTYVVEAAKLTVNLSSEPWRGLIMATYSLSAMIVAYNLVGYVASRLGEKKVRERGY